MAALPYMQLYVAEYLADTTHLTTAQHGAYLLLLMNYWQRGKPLNNADERLAFVARMSLIEWAANAPVIAEFFDVQGDDWTHHRVERDLQFVAAKSSKASAAGRASAATRFNERSTSVEGPLGKRSTIKTLTDLTTTRALSSGDDTSTLFSSKPDAPRLPKPETRAPEQYVKFWNENCGSLAKVSIFTDKRKAKLKQQIALGLTPDVFKEVIKKTLATPHCIGDNRDGWRVSFDFIIASQTNIAKILEGAYGGGKQPIVRRES